MGLSSRVDMSVVFIWHFDLRNQIPETQTPKNSLNLKYIYCFALMKVLFLLWLLPAWRHVGNKCNATLEATSPPYLSWYTWVLHTLSYKLKEWVFFSFLTLSTQITYTSSCVCLLYTVGMYVCVYVILVDMSVVWPFICYLRSYEFSLVDCCVDCRPNLQETVWKIK